MIEIVLNVLRGMGYNPENNKDKNYIKFSSPGFENFEEYKKDIIRSIMGKKLLQFSYGDNTQYIYYQPQKMSKQLGKKIVFNEPEEYVTLNQVDNESHVGILFKGDKKGWIQAISYESKVGKEFAPLLKDLAVSDACNDFLSRDLHSNISLVDCMRKLIGKGLIEEFRFFELRDDLFIWLAEID